MKLREYQQNLINDIKTTLKAGFNSICVVLSCGGGKSIIQAHISKSITNKNKYVLYLVHRKELCEQIKDTFKNYGVNMDYCFIISIQTFRKLKNFYISPTLILVDEAHTNLQAYKDVFSKYNCIKLGFTATPIRLKEKNLNQLFTKLITSVSTQWLIDNNFLSPFKYYSIPLVDLHNVKITNNEFNLLQLQDIMENNFLYKNSVNQWLKFAENKKTLVYCTSVESSFKTAQEFQHNNIKAAHLDGKTPKKEREEIIKNFKSGKIKVLCNAMLFSEGYDDKEIECILLLRPTQSLALHTQQSMRGMRYKKNKTCIIIDCVGNVYRFGLPTQEHEWDLFSKNKKIKENEVLVKECKKCFCVVDANCEVCPTCNTIFKNLVENKPKKKDEVNVDLIEVTNDLNFKNIKLIDFHGNNWEEVENFRKIKKYKFAWSLHYCIKNNIEIPEKYKKIRKVLNI